MIPTRYRGVEAFDEGLRRREGLAARLVHVAERLGELVRVERLWGTLPEPVELAFHSREKALGTEPRAHGRHETHENARDGRAAHRAEYTPAQATSAGAT